MIHVFSEPIQSSQLLYRNNSYVDACCVWTDIKDIWMFQFNIDSLMYACNLTLSSSLLTLTTIIQRTSSWVGSWISNVSQICFINHFSWVKHWLQKLSVNGEISSFATQGMVCDKRLSLKFGCICTDSIPEESSTIEFVTVVAGIKWILSIQPAADWLGFFIVAPEINVIMIYFAGSSFVEPQLVLKLYLNFHGTKVNNHLSKMMIASNTSRQDGMKSLLDLFCCSSYCWCWNMQSFSRSGFVG